VSAIPSPPLRGLKALVLGIANEHSMAFAPREYLQGGLGRKAGRGFYTYEVPVD
jgi:hypothetical protein